MKKDDKENKLYTYRCMKCKDEYQSEFENIIVKICNPCGDNSYENKFTNSNNIDVSVEE